MLERLRRGEKTEEGLLRLAEAARLYYLENLTQEHVADRMGTSRSKVSRMLKEARDRGLVEIKIHAPLTAATGLQEELGGRLGLRECLVLADPRGEVLTPAERVVRLAALGARYLQEGVADGSVVGVSWSSTVHHVVGSGYLRDKPDTTAVQLMGSIGGSIGELDGVSITSRLADALGGRAHYLHAPMLVADAVVRDGLLRDPHIRRTLEVARDADSMVVSVGAIDRRSGQYRTGYLDDAVLGRIREAGAVGDVCGSYFSRAGEPVDLEVNRRTIAIGFGEMRVIPNRVGISGGPNKALPNVGAVRAGLLNVLITDEPTAEGMLDVLNAERAATAAASRAD